MIKEQNATLSNKLKFVIEKAMSLEDKATRMEELLKEKERGVKVKTVFFSFDSYEQCCLSNHGCDLITMYIIVI